MVHSGVPRISRILLALGRYFFLFLVSPTVDRSLSDSTSGAENHNQTDDEKAKDSIAQFVNNLVQNAVHTARSTVDHYTTPTVTGGPSFYGGYRHSIHGSQVSAHTRFEHISPQMDESLTDDIKQAMGNSIRSFRDTPSPRTAQDATQTSNLLSVSTSGNVRLRRSQSLSPRDVKRRQQDISRMLSDHGNHPRTKSTMESFKDGVIGCSPDGLEGLDDSSRRIIGDSFGARWMEGGEGVKSHRSGGSQHSMGGLVDLMVKSIMSTAQNDLNEPILEEKGEETYGEFDMICTSSYIYVHMTLGDILFIRSEYHLSR